MQNKLSAATVKVRFIVSSESIDPLEISSTLDVMPNRTWLRGSPVHQESTKLHRENGWLLETTGQPEEVYVDRLAQRLMDAISHDRLATLRSKYGAKVDIELSVIISIPYSATVPSVSLSREQIRYLADCGGSLDVDIYVVDQS